jgi:hypothetical protein
LITDLLIELFGSILEALLGTFPTVEVPGWLNSGAAVMGTVFGYASSMGAWFPSGLLVTVMAALVLTWGIGYGIHVVRMVVSLFTGGGGKA